MSEGHEEVQQRRCSTVLGTQLQPACDPLGASVMTQGSTKIHKPGFLKASVTKSYFPWRESCIFPVQTLPWLRPHPTFTLTLALALLTCP